MKFLIDECLSQKLAKTALTRGHEASHIVWLKKSGWKDWNLKAVILEGDWTFLTKNSADFRGPEAAPSSAGQLKNRLRDSKCLAIVRASQIEPE